MWTEFSLTTAVATGLMLPELRRLYSKYGFAIFFAAGGGAVMAVSLWLLVIIGLIQDIIAIPSFFRMLWFLTASILPLGTFLFARRRFSVTPSLLPATGAFAVVSFIFINLAVGLAYGD